MAAGRKRPGKRTPRPPPLPKRAAAQPAEINRDPEIQVSYGPAGRDTLAAITDDLLSPPARDFQPSAPDLEFRVTPAGRDTLSAISREVAEVTDATLRSKISTVDYDKRPEPNTGVRPRSRSDSDERRRQMTHPGVAPPANPPRGGTAPVGRDTLDAIAKAVLHEGQPPSSATRSRIAKIEAYELANFVVRGDDLGQLAADATRREFVAERLLHRLPVSSMDQVERIDVAPWSVRGTLILRVWCRVARP